MGQTAVTRFPRSQREPSRYTGNLSNGTRWYFENFSQHFLQNSPTPPKTAFFPDPASLLLRREKDKKRNPLEISLKRANIGTPILRRRRLWRIKRDLTSRSDVRDPSSLHYAVTRQSAGQPHLVRKTAYAAFAYFEQTLKI